MALVPAGKRRLMIAQTAPNPMAEQAGQFDTKGLEPGNVQMGDPSAVEDPNAVAQQGAGDDLMGGNENPAENPLNDPAAELEQQADQIQHEQEMSNGGDSDVRQTVFDFLVGLGYPPRRLHEFKSQFVSETGSADSGTQVTIVIPDEMYGKNVQIPREKIKEIVQLIEQNGLSFQTYERKNEQLTLNFMSADAAQQQAMEDAGPGDILDKVYGKPGGKKAAAKTIQEFIKEGKDRQIAILKRVLGS